MWLEIFVFTGGIMVFIGLLVYGIGIAMGDTPNPFTIDGRAERRWKRACSQRAATLMALGVPPREARIHAEEEMTREAAVAVAQMKAIEAQLGL